MCKRLVVVEIFLKRKEGTYDVRELYDIFRVDENINKRIRETTSFFCFSTCARITSKKNSSISYDRESHKSGHRLVASISLKPCIAVDNNPPIQERNIS